MSKSSMREYAEPLNTAVQRLELSPWLESSIAQLARIAARESTMDTNHEFRHLAREIVRLAQRERCVDEEFTKAIDRLHRMVKLWSVTKWTPFPPTSGLAHESDR